MRVTRIEGSDVGALSDVLLSLGSTCCTVEDADLGTDAEREVYAGDAKVWHACDVTAMFAPETDIDGVMSDAMDILCAKIEYEKETIPGDDWVNVVLDSFAPTKVADGLWIVPAWTEQTEDQSKGCLNVTLEPGLAFGTGEHPTTRLCLSWLRDETDAFRGGSVLDFGTGSGVLAIGALLMGAARACGVDMEAQSVESAARNAALNGVEANLELFLADGSDGGGALPAGRGAGEEKFDAVVANILVGPVLSLAPLFAEYCAPGGRVCLSGVLTTQTPDVLEAYEPFFEDMTVREENGWAVVAARGARRSRPTAIDVFGARFRFTKKNESSPPRRYVVRARKRSRLSPSASRGVVVHVFVRVRYRCPLPRADGVPRADLLAVLLGLVPAQRHLAVLRPPRPDVEGWRVFLHRARAGDDGARRRPVAAERIGRVPEALPAAATAHDVHGPVRGARGQTAALPREVPRGSRARNRGARRVVGGHVPERAAPAPAAGDAGVSFCRVPVPNRVHRRAVRPHLECRAVRHLARAVPAGDPAGTPGAAEVAGDALLGEGWRVPVLGAFGAFVAGRLDVDVHPA